MKKVAIIVIGLALSLGLAGCSGDMQERRANSAAASTLNTTLNNDDGVKNSLLTAVRYKTVFGGTRVSVAGEVLLDSEDELEQQAKGIATRVVNVTGKVLRIQDGTLDFNLTVGDKETSIQEVMEVDKDKPVSFKKVKAWVESGK